MASAVLHLPLDWERAPEIRLFANQVELREFAILAPLFYVRMWSEWGLAAVEWRAI